MKRKKVRSKHNNLLNYFIHDARDLSPAYLASCRKFFDSICWPRYYGGGPDLDGKIFRLRKPEDKLQAPSVKQSPQLKGIKNYEN
jgi:hypothetical protein